MKRLSLVVALVTTAAGGVCPTSAAETTLPPCPQTAAVVSPQATSPHSDCYMHSGDLDLAVNYWGVPELPQP